jgi:prophage antirepressor-like protein
MTELAKAANFYFQRNYLNGIRVIERDDVQWFAAVDVCKILEIKNPTRALNDFPENERMTLANMKGHSGQRGGARFLNFINEAGLYRLIFKSRKPEAEKFKTWIFNEVLPSIRKYGLYSAALPKNWVYRGKELIWRDWIIKKEKAYFARWPDKTWEDFMRSLPY